MNDHILVLSKKIAIIGPESTGKSTLSAALATALNTIWVPEYSRSYLERIQRPYEEQDLLHIAKGQLALEDEGFPGAGRFLVCDTNLYVIKVWSESRFGRCNRRILEWIAGRPYDLYLLTHIDTIWEYDPLREHQLPADRQYFYHQYRDIAINSGVPWVEMRRPHKDRVREAMEAVQLIG